MFPLPLESGLTVCRLQVPWSGFLELYPVDERVSVEISWLNRCTHTFKSCKIIINSPKVIIPFEFQFILIMSQIYQKIFFFLLQNPWSFLPVKQNMWWQDDSTSVNTNNGSVLYSLTTVHKKIWLIHFDKLNNHIDSSIKHDRIMDHRFYIMQSQCVHTLSGK